MKFINCQDARIVRKDLDHYYEAADRPITGVLADELDLRGVSEFVDSTYSFFDSMQVGGWTPAEEFPWTQALPR